MKKLIKKVSWYFFCALAGIYLILVLALFGMSKISALDDVDLASTKKQFTSEHEFQLLDTGLDSLKARVRLIRSAQKTIELEFFIFDLDDTARLLMHELIDKAKSGVRVRVLVDFSKPIFKLSPAYAKYLKEQGIEIKYYNTAPLYRVASVQHRSHRKILIADDTSAIVGGRNIADEYFDMDPAYNFLDTDVFVKGKVVEFIRSGFDQYFNSKLSVAPQLEDVEEENYKRITDFSTNRKSSEEILGKLHIASYSTKEHTCNDVIYVTDPPSSSSDHRKIFSTMVELSKEIKSRIDIESPYFVVGKGGYDLFKKLSDSNIEVNILTNGLQSSDATYVVSALMYKLYSLQKLNISLSVMNGNPVESQSSQDFIKNTRWGLHAKRMVIDQKHVLIGTYNIDPRSANLNSELIIICKDNPEFAREVLESMDARLKQSRRVLTKGEVESVFAVTDGASFHQKVMMILMLPLSSMFEFLL